MRDIEKYKDVLLNSEISDLTCCVIDLFHNGKCPDSCKVCKQKAIEWLLSEYKEPVLDEEERKYLSDVIRPFRKKVDTISKFHTVNTMQYIYFQMKDKNGWALPLFKKGTMYKGMVQGKHYTLEELDL